MAKHLSKYVNFWILSASRLRDGGLSRQLILPNVKEVRGILRIFALKNFAQIIV